MFKRLLIALAQIKAGNTSENIIKENPSSHIFVVSSKRNY